MLRYRTWAMWHLTCVHEWVQLCGAIYLTLTCQRFALSQQVQEMSEYIERVTTNHSYYIIFISKEFDDKNEKSHTFYNTYIKQYCFINCSRIHHLEHFNNAFSILGSLYTVLFVRPTSLLTVLYTWKKLFSAENHPGNDILMAFSFRESIKTQTPWSLVSFKLQS